MWGCCVIPPAPASDRPAWRRAEEQELSSNNNNIRENSETAKPVINAPCDVWKWRRQCPPMFKTNQLSKSGIDYLFYINMTRVLKFLPLRYKLGKYPNWIGQQFHICFCQSRKCYVPMLTENVVKIDCSNATNFHFILIYKIRLICLGILRVFVTSL